MKNNKNSYTGTMIAILLVVASGLFTSCNKRLPDAEPIKRPELNPGATKTIGEIISADPNYSIYLAAVKRVGMINKLNDPNNVFTVFAPDNAGFGMAGIASDAVINAMPIASVGAIVQYSIIPGQQFLSTGVGSDFPNLQLPTMLKIGDLPGTPLPLEMTSFPSSINGFWYDNYPVTAADNKAKNGVIHKTLTVVAPPSKVLKDAIYSDPNLSFFKAAIARADSGQSGLNSFDYLLGYAVTNMTVLVPNNTAFQTLIFGSVFNYLTTVVGLDAMTAAGQATALSASPDVFSNPMLYGVLTAATVRGILAYHLLASNKGAGFQPNIRVFANNFAKTPTFYQTLVNSSVAVHPGIMVNTTYAGPLVSGVMFTGLGTFPPGGQPYSGPAANAVSWDNKAVNGVYYVIDKVLLPQ